VSRDLPRQARHGRVVRRAHTSFVEVSCGPNRGRNAAHLKWRSLRHAGLFHQLSVWGPHKTRLERCLRHASGRTRHATFIPHPAHDHWHSPHRPHITRQRDQPQTRGRRLVVTWRARCVSRDVIWSRDDVMRAMHARREATAAGIRTVTCSLSLHSRSRAPFLSIPEPPVFLQAPPTAPRVPPGPTLARLVRARGPSRTNAVQ
jgi:hypothetical protein